LAQTALELKSPAHAVPERVRAMMDERRSLANEVAQLRRELAMSGGATALETPEINGIKFHAQVLTGVTGKDLPALVDEHKARLGSGAILLIADTGDKAAVAAGVTADLADKLSAVDLLRAAVAELGGKGGGGRPEMAQGGGASVDNAQAAIAAATTLIKG
jgi:alanyl-tRNA synthetase